MIEKKEIQNIRRRIRKAKRSYNAMGDMCLAWTFRDLTLEQLQFLRKTLAESRSPLTYLWLDEEIKSRLEASKVTVAVEVKQLVPDTDLDQDDRHEAIKGVRYYTVKGNPPNSPEEAALDEFHATIPIACLDDFSIKAYQVDPVTREAI